MTDTRESIATNAAAWVLHHGYDDEDDTSDARIETDDEQQIELARQVARRVLRHIDVSPDQVEPIRARGPIHEALANVEEALRDRTWPPTGAMCRDMADVIRRALQEIPFHHDDCDVPEGHVVVPIEELEALRTWSETEWSRPPGAVGDLLAHLPEPEPSAPIDGYVQDAGGGVVTVLIDRDTESYPRNGERARITFGTVRNEDTMRQPFMEDDFGPHDPIGKPQRCGGCGEPWPCPEAQR